MNLAGRIKASIREGINERKADALAQKIGNKKARAEYRKELVKATAREGKIRATAKAKRKAQGLKGSVNRIKANLPKDSKNKGERQNHYSIGNSKGGSIFELGK